MEAGPSEVRGSSDPEWTHAGDPWAYRVQSPSTSSGDESQAAGREVRSKLKRCQEEAQRLDFLVRQQTEEINMLEQLLQLQRRDITELGNQVEFLRIAGPGEELELAAMGADNNNYFFDWEVTYADADGVQIFSRKVHRIILASKSEVLQNHMREALNTADHDQAPHKTKIVSLQTHIPVPEILNAFFDFFYSASVAHEDLTRMWGELLTLATEYKVELLKQLCEQAFIENVTHTPENILLHLELGLKHNSEVVVTEAVKYQFMADEAAFMVLLETYPLLQVVVSHASTLEEKRCTEA